METAEEAGLGILDGGVPGRDRGIELELKGRFEGVGLRGGRGEDARALTAGAGGGFLLDEREWKNFRSPARNEDGCLLGSIACGLKNGSISLV
jgi:hypothetical protein